MCKRNRTKFSNSKELKSVSVMEPQLISQAQEREGHRDPPCTLPEIEDPFLDGGNSALVIGF